MIARDAEKILDNVPVEKRYGIYFKGKPLYISTVNVYLSKSVARNKLKDYLGSGIFDQATHKWIQVGKITDGELDKMIASNIIEIKEVI